MKAWLGAAFVVAWSSGFVGAVLADRAAGPAPLLAWRYQLTAGVLVVACLLTPVRHRLRTLTARRVAEQVVLGLLSHAVFLGGVFGSAAVGVEAGTAALVCALQPMLVTGAGGIWFGDRLRTRQWLGLLLGIGGVALTVGGPGGPAGGGVLLVVASLLGLSAATLLERRWRPEVPVLLALTIQVVTGAGAFSAYAAATSGLAVERSSALLGALVWLVLLSGLGGYASFIACLRRLGATATSTLLYLTPAVTTLWAWLMFAQPPRPVQLAGLVVALVAVWLSLTSDQPASF